MATSPLSSSPEYSSSMPSTPRPFGMTIEAKGQYVILNPEEAFNLKAPSIEECELKEFILSWLQDCAREKKTGFVLCDRRFNWRVADPAKVSIFIQALFEIVVDQRIHVQMLSAGINDADARLFAQMIKKDLIASLNIQKNRLTQKGERMLEKAKAKHSSCVNLDYRNHISDR